MIPYIVNLSYATNEFYDQIILFSVPVYKTHAGDMPSPMRGTSQTSELLRDFLAVRNEKAPVIWFY